MRFTDLLEQGSSPLTRGKLALDFLSPHSVGLIPAHAGKTIDCICGKGLCRAHPRSRGENCDSSRGHARESGSSPLTRGKPHGWTDRRRAPGLIPAHAGKTSRGWRGQPSARAHPRSRGENGTLDESAHTLTGSSPLTRGKRKPGAPLARSEGLIPAHAGKTEKSLRLGQKSRAHPRSRGENEQAAYGIPPMLGSSPLTRGKPCVHRSVLSCLGLIPAHAGKTEQPQQARHLLGAHPRSRGENRRRGRR